MGSAETLKCSGISDWRDNYNILWCRFLAIFLSFSDLSFFSENNLSLVFLNNLHKWVMLKRVNNGSKSSKNKLLYLDLTTHSLINGGGGGFLIGVPHPSLSEDFGHFSACATSVSKTYKCISHTSFSKQVAKAFDFCLQILSSTSRPQFTLHIFFYYMTRSYHNEDHCRTIQRGMFSSFIWLNFLVSD